MSSVGRDMRIVLDEIGFILIGLRTQKTKEMIKTLAAGPMIEWSRVGRLFIRRQPVFPDRKGIVPVIPQYFCNGAVAGRDPAVIPGKSGRHRDMRKTAFVHKMTIA